MLEQLLLTDTNKPEKLREGGCSRSSADIIRSMDPNFEMVYKSLDETSPPAVGVCGVEDAGGDLVIADGTSAQTKRISVRTSFVDTESGNVGVLQRGYIVQTAGTALSVDSYVKPSSTGLPVTADPGSADDQEVIYGIVIGLANQSGQTKRSNVANGQLAIIKVGDF